MELECGNCNRFIQSEVSGAFSVMFESGVQVWGYTMRYFMWYRCGDTPCDILCGTGVGIHHAIFYVVQVWGYTMRYFMCIWYRSLQLVKCFTLLSPCISMTQIK
jgi:hypothetical protein